MAESGGSGSQSHGKAGGNLHLDSRGRIAEGYVGDIAVFDPEAVHTDATYEVPDVTPTGIRAVLRNGNLVVDSGVVV